MVELLDTNDSKIQLDSLEEFKQLSANLQRLIKEKQTQYTNGKTLNFLSHKKRFERMLLTSKITRHANLVDAAAAGPFSPYDDSQFGFNVSYLDEDTDSFASSSHTTQSRLNGLIPGAPAQTPTQYFSSNSLDGQNVGGLSMSMPRPILSRLDELVALADPLIVLDGHLLENSFNQLKEIIGAENTSSTDEQLVKLLIRHDCDLNRVVPIALNFEWDVPD